MFKKAFKVISNCQLKGSERKKLRGEILSTFPTLTDESLHNLIPSKELIVTAKIITHNEEVVTIYLVQKLPVLFEVNKILYPTVYMLWTYPDLVPTFTTWSQVFNHISNGADLMLPGIVLPNGPSSGCYGNLNVGDRVAINLTTNRAPIAIGQAAMSSVDMMYRSVQKGRAVYILHTSGDHLWSFSKKIITPELGAPILSSDKVDCSNLIDENSKTLNETCEESLADHLQAESDIAKALTDHTELETINQEISHLNISEQKESNENQDQEDSQKLMDDLLDYCFFKAWRSTAKKVTLPILTSNFFKLHMIPACPSTKTLDIKKSSYKKLSKYLSKMVDLEIIKTTETKGVASIVRVNEGHPLIKNFIDFEPKEPPAQMSEVSSLNKPEIQEMYVVTAAVVPVLGHFDARKGESFPLNTIRKYITEYVRKEKLQNHEKKGIIKTDVHLKRIIKSDIEEITWEELYKYFFANMTHSYQMTVPGQKSHVTKGKLEPVDIQIAKRAGNKKVTLINNLEIYGIDLKEFAKDCQHGVAASTSIANVPGRKTPQLLVQGNQVAFVGKLLSEKYHIPKRNIRGLELAPKEKK